MVFTSDDTPFADNVAFNPGISLQVDASSVYESMAAASCFRRQVFDLAAAGLELSISVEHSSRESQHVSEIEFVFGLLAEAMLDAGGMARDLIIVTGAKEISPQAAWLLRCQYLDSGPLYIRPSHPMKDEAWRQAWELRTTAKVGLLCVPFVLSPCRLLPAELAASLVPGSCVQGPPESAWAAVSVDVTDVADTRGQIDREDLAAAVRGAVEAGETLHSCTRWPTARLRHDAWLNRRLAINIAGIGALVRRRGLDPERFAALDEMLRLIRCVRDYAVAESQRMAATAGHVPALEQADLANALPGGRLRDGWSENWRLAVAASAMRHRNLLVLSPWSLFPPGDMDLRFFNLLPILRFADTCAFGPPPDLADWNFNQFRGFHQQTAAVLQQRGVSHRIAVRA